VSPIIALIWKEQDRTENQPMGVKEGDVSGWNKMIQCQSYQNGDSVDYN
jgi:hypothetical protein